MYVQLQQDLRVVIDKNCDNTGCGHALSRQAAGWQVFLPTHSSGCGRSLGQAWPLALAPQPLLFKACISA